MGTLCTLSPSIHVDREATNFTTAHVFCVRYIYIVCATGKSADEMLAILESRINNSPEDELKIAAAEQSKITKLRLEKLLAQ